MKAGQKFILGSKTLLVAGPSRIISGNEVKLKADGVIVADKLHAFSAASSTIEPTELLKLTAKLFTADNEKLYVIESSRLSSGVVATIPGQSISVNK